MDWLENIPVAVVRAHVLMLERIAAEEAMTAATANNVRMKDVRPVWAGWQRLARPRTKSAHPAGPGDLAAMGIKVKVVKRGRT